VIIHVFHEQMREFYKLEKIWADGKAVDIGGLTGPKE
jgi:ribosomal silencing factor RsfS